MTIVDSFKKLPRLIQIILLLIPGVNWVTEVLVRGSAALNGKAGKQLIVLILAIIPPTGIILGWADLIWCLLYNRLILTEKINKTKRKFGMFTIRTFFVFFAPKIKIILTYKKSLSTT